MPRSCTFCEWGEGKRGGGDFLPCESVVVGLFESVVVVELVVFAFWAEFAFCVAFASTTSASARASPAIRSLSNFFGIFSTSSSDSSPSSPSLSSKSFSSTSSPIAFNSSDCSFESCKIALVTTNKKKKKNWGGGNNGTILSYISSSSSKFIHPLIHLSLFISKFHSSAIHTHPPFTSSHIKTYFIEFLLVFFRIHSTFK